MSWFSADIRDCRAFMIPPKSPPPSGTTTLSTPVSQTAMRKQLTTTQMGREFFVEIPKASSGFIMEGAMKEMVNVF